MHRSLPHTVPSRRSFASPSSPCQLYEFPRSPNPTLWQILGVKENASIAEVKAAYYDRVRTLHPDAQSSNDHHPISQKDRFHLLQTAYETLGNADKRASYISAQRFRFADRPNSPSRRPPLDPHYNPASTRWTTWEGRSDHPRSSPFTNSQRPPPRNPTSPFRDPFSAAWSQSRNSSPYGKYHTGAAMDGPAKDRVVTWLLCWMLFGILLSQNQASNYDNALKASHSSALSSLRDAEDSARGRGEWRPAVESRLARFRAREEQVKEEKFQAEVLAMMQQEFRNKQHRRQTDSSPSSSNDGPSPSPSSPNLQPPTLEEARRLSQQMIEEELRDTRAAREERRLRNLSYPPGFIGPKQQIPGMVRVVRSKADVGEGEGRGARPLTGKERRKELMAAGVREPGNPARDLPEGSTLKPVEGGFGLPAMTMGGERRVEVGV